MDSRIIHTALAKEAIASRGHLGLTVTRPPSVVPLHVANVRLSRDVHHARCRHRPSPNDAPMATRPVETTAYAKLFDASSRVCLFVGTKRRSAHGTYPMLLVVYDKESKVWKDVVEPEESVDAAAKRLTERMR